MSYSNFSVPSFVKLSEDLREELVPIPADADDVCPMCRSWRHARFEKCSNCLEAEGVLAAPCRQVIPISLYSKPSQMRDWLTFYKDASYSANDEYRQYLAAVVGRFLFENLRTLVAIIGGYDVVTFVPSSRRVGVHPIEKIIGACSAIFAKPIVGLLSKGAGELDHRIMSDDAFLVSKDAAGQRILLVDDVYTTGARAQSAASALHMHGATVVGILVIARRINPDFNLTSNAVWRRQQTIDYDYRTALDWLVSRMQSP